MIFYILETIKVNGEQFSLDYLQFYVFNLFDTTYELLFISKFTLTTSVIATFFYFHTIILIFESFSFHFSWAYMVSLDIYKYFRLTWFLTYIFTTDMSQVFKESFVTILLVTR